MKKAFLFFLFFLPAFFSENILAQQTTAPAGFDLSNYGVRIEPDKRVMTVLAALEMASVNTTLSDQGAKFRQQLQEDQKTAPDDLRNKITLFIAQYKKRHPQATDAQIVAPFISMAYSLTPAPDLADPVITNELPGDLLDVLDFAPIVREFYRRSGFGAKIVDYVKLYQQASDLQLRSSSKQMVGELLDYLHTRPQTSYTETVKTQTTKSGKKKPTLEKSESVNHERRFFIVPELLMPKENVKLLNVGDDYYAITAPDVDLNASEARRAFLQFVIDPLVLKNSKDIAAFSPTIKNLLNARRQSNPDVSPDVLLAVSRSLVSAIDAREVSFQTYNYAVREFRSNPDAKPLSVDQATRTSKLTEDLYLIDGKYSMPKIDDEITLRLAEDYKKGAVLDFYFAEQLKGLENSGFDIAASLRDMILSLETAKEDDRLEENAAAVKRGEQNRKDNANKTITYSNPVTARLLEIDKIIESKNYAQADAELKKLLDSGQTDARIYYNRGRVAGFAAENAADDKVRASKIEEAKIYYSNAVQTELNKGNDPKQKIDFALVSHSYVALAKIYEFYDQNAYAMKIYDAAIKIGDIPGGAYGEALAGKQKLLKNQ